MESLKKIKHFIFNEGIPKHVTSGVCIHHPLGVVADADWSLAIVITRDDHSTVPFSLPDNLLNVSIQVKLRCLGLRSKLFAFGHIDFSIHVLPQFEMSICKKQFHNLFEDTLNIESRIDITTRKLDPLTLAYLENIRNYLFVGGKVTFYAVEENNVAKRNAELEEISLSQNSRFKTLSNLSKDINNMYIYEVFTDITLQCASQTFRVHKAILSTRSPVFNAMFQNPMKESYENEVVIKDMEPHILKALLEYIYSGEISDLSTMSSCDLLSAADRYQLPGLKDICVNYLQTDITVHNVLRVLVYADLYDEVLKNCAMVFICKHYDYLKTTAEWLTLKSEKSLLMMDVMEFKIQSLKAK